MTKKPTKSSKVQEKLEYSKKILNDAIEAMKGSVEDLREQLRDKDDNLLKPLEKVGNILSIGMIVCDQKGLIILANHEANLIFGYDDLTYIHIDKIIEHQTSNNNESLCFPKWIKARNLNVFQPNEENNILFGIKKDSSKIYVHVNASYYFTKDGDKHYILLIKDSSKNDSSNRQNITLLEKFQSVSNALNLTDNFGICILEKTNNYQKITYCNSGFIKITGYAEGDIINNSGVFLLEGAETEKDELEKIKNCIDHEKTYEGFIKCYDKEGHAFIGNVKVTGVTHKNQDKTIISIYVENMDSRQDTVHNLKRRIKSLEYLEEIAGVGWWTLDMNTKKLNWSNGVYDIHETSKEYYNPTLETALDFYSTEMEKEQVKAMLFESLENGTAFKFVANIITAKNNKKEIYVKGTTLKSMPNVVFGIVSDLTYKKNKLLDNNLKL